MCPAIQCYKIVYLLGLESHHCSHEGSITRSVFEQDGCLSVSCEDDDIETEPVASIDGLDFKDTGSQVLSEEIWCFLIRREFAQIFSKVIVPIGKFPILESAEDVHSLCELIIEPSPEDIFSAALIEPEVFNGFIIGRLEKAWVKYQRDFLSGSVESPVPDVFYHGGQR